MIAIHKHTSHVQTHEKDCKKIWEVIWFTRKIMFITEKSMFFRTIFRVNHAKNHEIEDWKYTIFLVSRHFSCHFFSRGASNNNPWNGKYHCLCYLFQKQGGTMRTWEPQTNANGSHQRKSKFSRPNLDNLLANYYTDWRDRTHNTILVQLKPSTTWYYT